LRIQDWTMPDGTRLEFGYDPTTVALRSVISNRGYAILFEPASPSGQRKVKDNGGILARAQPPPLAPSAPRTCDVTRGAYCIERVGLTIEVSRRASRRARLRIYDPAWEEHALSIIEPPTCRRALSDTVRLLSARERHNRLRFVLRLARNGSCDLAITVGSERADPDGYGILTALTQIRACRTRPCAGPVIGGLIRERFGWRFR